MQAGDANHRIPSRTREGATGHYRVTTLTAEGAAYSEADVLAVESPLEVRIGGKPITVLMRTPDFDSELVTGFLFCEGVIADADDILSIERAGNPNVIEVRLTEARRPPGERLFFSNSSCGICGKQSLASIEVQADPVRSDLTVSRKVLATLPEKLKVTQPVFQRTGGVHASALFTPVGELIAVREDVGRHNALDKIIGWALNDGRIPLATNVLLVSGRLSYELVQKAIVAGLPVIAGVGAPSSAAVELAERFGITLVGFLRGASMNVYAHSARIQD